MVTKNIFFSALKNERGVTMTELSVGVAIISLMIAGTFGGLTIVKAAKVRKAATEFTSNMSAITEFQSQYGSLPGDLPNASSYFTGAHDGNGDGIVSNVSTTEDLYVWEHLGRAKFIAGTYTGAVVDGSTRYGASVNAPSSEPFITGVFSFYAYNSVAPDPAPIYGTAGHALGLGQISAGLPVAGFMLAKDAYSIDVKLDDGLPSSGMFYTVRDTTGCTDGLYSATVAEGYVLSDATNATCKLYYWQKKF